MYYSPPDLVVYLEPPVAQHFTSIGHPCSYPAAWEEVHGKPLTITVQRAGDQPLPSDTSPGPQRCWTATKGSRVACPCDSRAEALWGHAWVRIPHPITDTTNATTLERIESNRSYKPNTPKHHMMKGWRKGFNLGQRQKYRGHEEALTAEGDVTILRCPLHPLWTGQETHSPTPTRDKGGCKDTGAAGMPMETAI